MTVTVREVSSKRDLNDFVRFPHLLYGSCAQWVPPLHFDELNTLNSTTNPSFEFCRAKYWLAYRDGKPVARIAGIINDRYIELTGNRYARFGWIDFIDDNEVSTALFDTVESWARTNGMTGIQGPLGFSDFDKEGMLVEGFDEMGTMVGIYNYPYYPVHLERHGYRKEADWLEFRITLTRPAYEKIERLAAIVEKRCKLSLLPLRRAKDILPRAKEIFQLINLCYKDLYCFVPLSEKQVEYYTKQYFSFVRPEFVPILQDTSGRIVAFGITIPSLSLALRKANGKLFPFGFLHLLGALKKNDKADLMLIAIHPDYQGKGLNAIIMREAYKVYEKNHIGVVEACPQLETNQRVLTLWEHFNAQQHKRRRSFIKMLEGR
jgi:GNAT superfamily N-acetyltransferase